MAGDHTTREASCHHTTGALHKTTQFRIERTGLRYEKPCGNELIISAETWSGMESKPVFGLAVNHGHVVTTAVAQPCQSPSLHIHLWCQRWSHISVCGSVFNSSEDNVERP